MPTPERIGPYAIDRLLGRGGMGEVLRAVDTRWTAERAVAIKILSAEHAGDPEFVKRFEREVELAATLKHPNIVTIHDRGEHGGRPYFVMELLDGRDLGAWMRSAEPDDLISRLDLAIELCDALDYAHRRGVVHRDVKPSNVFVVDDEGGRRAKLVDFGIARPTAIDGGETTVQPGTLRYMSPEQARSQTVDSKSDLFSLGIVLYELFVGKHPFEAGSPVLVVHAILNDDPVAPHEVVPEVPRIVSDAIVALMAKQATDRPDAAADVGRPLKDARLELVTQPRPLVADRLGSKAAADPERAAFVEHALRRFDDALDRGDVSAARKPLLEVLRKFPDETLAAARLDGLVHAVETGADVAAYRAHVRDAVRALDERRTEDARRALEAAVEAWPNGPDVAALGAAVEAAERATTEPAEPPEPEDRLGPATVEDDARREMSRGDRRVRPSGRRLAWATGAVAVVAVLAVLVATLRSDDADAEAIAAALERARRLEAQVRPALGDTEPTRVAAAVARCAEAQRAVDEAIERDPDDVRALERRAAIGELCESVLRHARTLERVPPADETSPEPPSPTAVTNAVEAELEIVEGQLRDARTSGEIEDVEELLQPLRARLDSLEATPSSERYADLRDRVDAIESSLDDARDRISALERREIATSHDVVTAPELEPDTAPRAPVDPYAAVRAALDTAGDAYRDALARVDASSVSNAVARVEAALDAFDEAVDGMRGTVRREREVEADRGVLVTHLERLDAVWALVEYHEALEARDPDRLRRAWPRAPDGLVDSLSDYASLDVALSCREVDVAPNGRNARADCVEHRRFERYGQRPSETRLRAGYDLLRSEGGHFGVQRVAYRAAGGEP